MRVVSILAAVLMVAGLAACGGGGGPSDLNLPSTPTSAPVTTTTLPVISGGSTPPTPVNGSATAQVPSYASLVARATGPRLAVFSAPNARSASSRLANPWLAIPGNSRSKVPQVLLVQARRSDGWVKVALPTGSKAGSGWVRATDVTVGQIVYRLRIALGAQTLTVFSIGRPVYQGPIAVGAAAKSTAPGRYFVHRVFTSAKSQLAGDPFVYGLIKRFAVLIPLGTPVDIVK